MLRAFEFQMAGEREVVAAENIVHALKYYTEQTGLSIDEIFPDDGDDIVEIPEVEWHKIRIRNDEYFEGGDEPEITTLAEEMKGQVEPAVMYTTVQ